jgi:hypothetical protein
MAEVAKQVEPEQLVVEQQLAQSWEHLPLVWQLVWAKRIFTLKKVLPWQP